MIAKVLSGGQTGVDQAALRAARVCGIPTGGTAAHCWQTEGGPAPWLADYGLTEHTRPGYPSRTRQNVADAHATLIVVEREPLTGGTKLTFDVAYRNAVAAGSDEHAGLFVAVLGTHAPFEVAEWVRECCGSRAGIVLNVAGPRESSSPGIGAAVEAWLTNVFREAGSER